MPGIASASTMMAALTNVCHHDSTLANEMMLRISPRMIAPMMAPAMPPLPPLRIVPPMTTAVIADRVSASPTCGVARSRQQRHGDAAQRRHQAGDDVGAELHGADRHAGFIGRLDLPPTANR